MFILLYDLVVGIVRDQVKGGDLLAIGEVDLGLFEVEGVDNRLILVIEEFKLVDA